MSTRPFKNEATVVCTCDVEFSEVEVNAMRLLGLRFALDCRVLNKDIQYEDTEFTYDRLVLPRFVEGARPSVHAVFETQAAMSDLHEHIITRDELIAEFTLTNLETGASEVQRSVVVSVNLAG